MRRDRRHAHGRESESPRATATRKRRDDQQQAIHCGTRSVDYWITRLRFNAGKATIEPSRTRPDRGQRVIHPPTSATRTPPTVATEIDQRRAANPLRSGRWTGNHSRVPRPLRAAAEVGEAMSRARMVARDPTDKQLQARRQAEILSVSGAFFFCFFKLLDVASFVHRGRNPPRIKIEDVARLRERALPAEGA